MKIFETLKKTIPILAATVILAVPAALATFVPVLQIVQGGTGATTAAGARANLGVAASGANSDITSLSGLTTALSVLQGGTGSTTASGARTNLLAAQSGSNSDITSLSGLTTALSATQGGTGFGSYTTGDLLYASSSTALSKLAAGSNGQHLVVSAGLPAWAANTSSITVTSFSSAGTAIAGFDTADATSAGFALTLPNAPVAGTRVSAKKIDSSANVVTVTRGGTSLIDGLTTYDLPAQYDDVTVIYDGTNWNIE